VWHVSYTFIHYTALVVGAVLKTESLRHNLAGMDKFIPSLEWQRLNALNPGMRALKVIIFPNDIVANVSLRHNSNISD
jgi:hypothetical protein